ncbi:putative SLAM family member 9-like [Triplophysa rosa]|uniref:SLAM family member 9-like n=1 Tax=Triplophysa rosa TaxID=992332 RepID=A0A9W7WNX6_TRIRA|nr:putative SLAM family member 9-like [Triplophysa rosa]
MFAVMLLCSCSWSLGVFATESVSVTEGDSVSLSVSLTLEQRGNKIMWRFGPTEVIIAEMNVKNNTKQCYDDRADGRFRDRLKLDVQSVSLIITDIRITHSGLYNITISRQEMPLKRFNITVYPRLPVPVISRVSSQCSSSSCCCVLCSVMNCLDDSYTCVLNNSITNQTQHLNTDVCHKCSEFYCCCGFTEVVIRLVVSALVGVAAVAVLVYDIRSRRDEQKKRSDTQLNDK